MAEEKAASRGACSEVDGERHCSSARRAPSRTTYYERRAYRTLVNWAGAHFLVAPDHRSSVGRHPRKGQLHTNVLSESPAGGNYTRLDFHLLRLDVQLADQVIDHRDNRRDVANDELVRSV